MRPVSPTTSRCADGTAQELLWFLLRSLLLLGSLLRRLLVRLFSQFLLDVCVRACDSLGLLVGLGLKAGVPLDDPGLLDGAAALGFRVAFELGEAEVTVGGADLGACLFAYMESVYSYFPTCALYAQSLP
jgi:hypothetical protein